MATKKKKEPPFVETMFSGITDRVNQKMRSFRLGVGERQIGSALESANKAQQEPTFQQMNINDSRRGLEAGAAADDRASRDLEFQREMNPNQNQEDLDALQSEVIQERQSEIFSPSDLLPAGRSEFDAASRGEIPGYAIKDPGARAAFARARQSDPGFGSRERVNAEQEPIPFDQELMDDIVHESDETNRDYKSRGISDKTVIAQIEAYREAKKNGRHNKLYSAKDQQNYERALQALDDPNGPADVSFITDEMEFGGFDYKAMGERAQKGQQPRSAGGVGDGPLRAGMDPKSQSILEKRLADAEERIKNAGEKADPKDLELRDNLERVLGAPKINRHIGDDPHARASHGNYPPRRQNEGQEYRTGGMLTADGSRMDGYRVQNAPRGSGRYAAEIAGSSGGVAGGGFTPGRTPAYNDAPLSASMQDPVTPDGKGYTLSDGTIMPDPDGMSEADFAGAVADNPVVAAEAFEYATENRTMTQKQRAEYQKLQQGSAGFLRADQQKIFDNNRKVEMGRLAADVFRANKAHAEQARSKALRDAKTAANESRTRMNRLERIYRQHLDPDTKNKVDSLGNLYAAFATDEALVEAVTKPLDEEQFRQAAKWLADQEKAFNAMQGKNAGAVAAIQQGEAPAPSDEAHWKFLSKDQGFGEQVTGAQSTPSGDRYGVIVEGDQVFLRLPAQDEWENVSEKDRVAVAGIILPPEGVDELEWIDFKQPIQSGAGGEKIMANPDGTLATQEAGTEEAATTEETVDFGDNAAGRVIQGLPPVAF